MSKSPQVVPPLTVQYEIDEEDGGLPGLLSLSKNWIDDGTARCTPYETDDEVRHDDAHSFSAADLESPLRVGLRHCTLRPGADVANPLTIDSPPSNTERRECAAGNSRASSRLEQRVS